MARQSFRGAGGAGAVVVPYVRNDVALSEYELTELSEAELADRDLRLGALMIVASGILTLAGIIAASWTFAG
jgi:hypothetical protein